MAFLVLGANSVSGYTVKNSLRFNSGSSDSLTRTPSSATNRKTWTWSFWFKISYINPNGMYIFGASQDGNNRTAFGYNYASVSGDAKIWFHNRTASTFNTNLITTQVFRDISAWYHLVVAVDTTQATSSNRAKIYLNGSQITALDTATYPSQNTDTWVNSTNAHAIGKYSGGASDFVDGYIADAYLIDGQQLDATSFGETDTDTGIWKPKAYTGTYGTNGFYLQFKNSASLGTDSSGNGNTFTVNNLTSIDQTTDTPTNNFCTLGGLVFSPKTTGGTYSDGNLTVEATSSDVSACGNFAVTTGKWYWETKIINDGANTRNIGITITNLAQNTTYGFYIGNPTSGTNTSGTIGYNGGNGNIYQKNVGGTQTTTSTSTTNATGDIIGIALDMTNGTITYYKNGTQLTNTPVSLDSLSEWQSWGVLPAYRIDQTSTKVSCNFGNPPYSANSYTDGAGYGNFSYAVPSGYYALNTKNLANFG